MLGAHVQRKFFDMYAAAIKSPIAKEGACQIGNRTGSKRQSLALYLMIDDESTSDNQHRSPRRCGGWAEQTVPRSLLDISGEDRAVDRPASIRS